MIDNHWSFQGGCSNFFTFHKLLENPVEVFVIVEHVDHKLLFEVLMIFWDVVLESLIATSDSYHNGVLSKFAVASIWADQIEAFSYFDNWYSNIVDLDLLCNFTVNRVRLLILKFYWRCSKDFITLHFDLHIVVIGFSHKVLSVCDFVSSCFKTNCTD